jgi:pimeloyl-ACP methyl ester carboxylesterase
MNRAPIANGINYTTRGNPEDPALLFVGGMGAGASSWTLITNTINIGSRAPLFLIAYDPRCLYGSGDTADYELAALVDDARDLLTYLGIERAHVLGWSMGGMVAQAFAYTYPAMVDRLILLSTVPASRTNPALAELNDAIRVATGMPANPTDADFKALMPTLTKISFNNKTLAWLFSQATKLSTLLDSTIYENLAQQWRMMDHAETYAHLGEITAPTLVAHGDADRLVPIAAQDLILKALTCMTSKQTVKGGSHACGIENFLQVNHLIREWVS